MKYKKEVKFMNLKQKQKAFREKYFATGGLIVVSILGIAGILMIYFSGIFNIFNSNISSDGQPINLMLVIMGGFFYYSFFILYDVVFYKCYFKTKKRNSIFL